MQESPTSTSATRIRPRSAAPIAALLAVLVGILFTISAPPQAAKAAAIDDIFTLVNQSRAEAGLKPFRHNPKIDAVSLSWAKTMASRNSMVHNPDFAKQIPSGWTGAAENIAKGYKNAKAVHEGWMNSPGHRANILGDYTDIGIAFITVDGTTWAVENFGKYKTDTSGGGSTPPARPTTKPTPPKAKPSPTAAAPTPPAVKPAPVKPAPTAPATVEPVKPAPQTPPAATPTAPTPDAGATPDGGPALSTWQMFVTRLLAILAKWGITIPSFG